jgi:hypothetical protein
MRKSRLNAVHTINRALNSLPAAKFDDTSYLAWRDAITAKYRAEYAPYDTMMEFEVGMAAAALGTNDLGWHDLEAQAFDRGVECAFRLARVFHNT